MLVYENVCMITSSPKNVFQQYHSEKHLSEFYPQDGGESQLASKLRHCQPMYTRITDSNTVCRKLRYFTLTDAERFITF